MRRSISSRRCLVFFIPCLALISIVHAADWPQFRGPAGQGHADGPAPLHWSETENVVWKTPLSGKGWSSPVIAGEQIWLTTADAKTPSEAEIEARLASNTGNQPLVVVSNLVMRAICLDRKTGQIIHDINLMTEAEPEPVHALNSYASPTPVITDGKVYCHFGPNGTACVDALSGKILWTNQEKKLVVKTENGAGSTPVLWRNRLIVHFDGSDKQFIAALDTETGKVAWMTERSGEMDPNPQLKKSYGTPLMITLEDKEVILSPASNWLYAYDPATGSELWKLSYEDLGFSVVPRPVVHDGTVFLSTSFMRAQLLAVQIEEAGKAIAPKIKWRYAKQVSQMPSPIVVEGLLYFIADKGGVLTCLDAESGELVWSERLGGNYSASPVYADGKLYFSDREGTTHVIAPGRQFKQLAKNQLDTGLMASPAIVDGAMYLRTDEAIYRVE